MAAIQASCVLMDLRGFGPNNKGCRFELQQVAASKHLRNVAILMDKATDKNLIDTIIGTGTKPNQVHMISADSDRIEEPSVVLQSLLAS